LELFGLQGNKGITHGFVLFVNVKVSCNGREIYTFMLCLTALWHVKQKFQIAHARNQSELTNFATKLEVVKYTNFSVTYKVDVLITSIVNASMQTHLLYFSC
jgi:hypothetical protein